MNPVAAGARHPDRPPPLRQPTHQANRHGQHGVVAARTTRQRDSTPAPTAPPLRHTARPGHTPSPDRPPGPTPARRSSTTYSELTRRAAGCISLAHTSTQAGADDPQAQAALLAAHRDLAAALVHLGRTLARPMAAPRTEGADHPSPGPFPRRRRGGPDARLLRSLATEAVARDWCEPPPGEGPAAELAQAARFIRTAADLWATHHDGAGRPRSAEASRMRHPAMLGAASREWRSLVALAAEAADAMPRDAPPTRRGRMAGAEPRPVRVPPPHAPPAHVPQRPPAFRCPIAGRAIAEWANPACSMPRPVAASSTACPIAACSTSESHAPRSAEGGRLSTSCPIGWTGCATSPGLSPTWVAPRRPCTRTSRPSAGPCTVRRTPLMRRSPPRG